MAINNLDNLVAAMKNSTVLPINKASLANQITGSPTSLWRSAGFPAQGAIPTTAAVCDATLTGALPLRTKTVDQDRVLSKMAVAMVTIGNTLIVEDRLMHMGGLLGNVATAQTVNIDISANLASNNLAERIGSADYSEIQWYLEWYLDTGSTAVTPTVQVTFHDDTTGSVNVDVLGAIIIPATVRAGRRYKLNPTNGKYIKSIQTVTLSATTGTAGNFGVTAVKPLTTMSAVIANILSTFDWSFLNLPKICDDACVSFSIIPATTSSGVIAGNIEQAVN